MDLSLAQRHPSFRSFNKSRYCSVPTVLRKARNSDRTAPRRSPFAVRVESLSLREVGTIAFSTVLSGILVFSPPCLAQVKTVAAGEVSAVAKPLAVEKVEKKRVWLVFVVGAASLFVFINLVENNPEWFPAVSRANKAMTTRRKRRIEKAQVRELEAAEAEAARLTKSVEAELAEARRRRLEQQRDADQVNRTSETSNGQNNLEMMVQNERKQQHGS